MFLIDFFNIKKYINIDSEINTPELQNEELAGYIIYLIIDHKSYFCVK